MLKDNSNMEQRQLGLHIRIILLIALSCFFMGCWKKKVAEKPDTKTKDETISSKIDGVGQADSSDRTDNANQPPQNDTTSDQQASPTGSNQTDDLNNEKEHLLISLDDIPPPTQGFSGEDQQMDSPIPPEIERTIKEYEDGNFDVAFELLKYPHPQVRLDAIELILMDDEKHNEAAQVVSVLRGALEDPHQEVRTFAARALGRMGEKAKYALPQLEKMLEKEGEAEAALNGIGGIGPAAAPMVPRLIKLLKSADFNDAQTVIWALGRIGPAAVEAAPAIVRFKGLDRAGPALGRIGARDELLKLINVENHHHRKIAIEGLGVLKNHDEQTTSALVNALLFDDYVYCRVEAATALAMVKPTTNKIAEALGKAASNDSKSVKVAALKAIEQMDPAFSIVVPYLQTAAADDDIEVSHAASELLGKINNQPEIALASILDQIADDFSSFNSSVYKLRERPDEYYPILVRWVKDDSVSDRRRALSLFALWWVVSEDGAHRDAKIQAVRTIAKALMSKTQPRDVRAAAAAITLLEFDKAYGGEDCLQALQVGLKTSKMKIVWNYCVILLVERKDKAAIAELNKALTNEDYFFVATATEYIGAYGNDAAIAVPSLLDIAKGTGGPAFYDKIWQQPSLRKSAISALSAIPAKHEQILPELLSILKSKDVGGEAAMAAAYIIVENDLDASPLLDKIIQLLEQDHMEWFEFIRAIGLLGSKGAPAVGHLRKCLQSTSKRGIAAENLSEIGIAASDAVPDLIKAAETWITDPDNPYDSHFGNSQVVALKAVRKIGTHQKEFVEAVPKLIEHAALVTDVLSMLAESKEDVSSTAKLIEVYLDDNNEYRRKLAIDILAKCNTVSPHAVKKIQELAINDEYCKKAAEKALKLLKVNQTDK